jgi:hypothetical protein
MSFYLKTKISIHGKEYECHCIEQTNRAKGTRYKAYGTFEGHNLEAQEPSSSKAIEHLKSKAEISLD